MIFSLAYCKNIKSRLLPKFGFDSAIHRYHRVTVHFVFMADTEATTRLSIYTDVTWTFKSTETSQFFQDQDRRLEIGFRIKTAPSETKFEIETTKFGRKTGFKTEKTSSSAIQAILLFVVVTGLFKESSNFNWQKLKKI